MRDSRESVHGPRLPQERRVAGTPSAEDRPRCRRSTRTNHALAIAGAPLAGVASSAAGRSSVRPTLDLPAPSGRAVWVRGFPWQRTEEQRVGVGSLESKVLCERHNNVLAAVDEQGVRLFRALAAIGRELDGQGRAPRMKLFPGADVERWLLKALLGLASSGSARAIDGERLPWSPPAEWCRALFGQRPFSAPWGLYVSGTLGEGMRLDASEITLAPLRTDHEAAAVAQRRWMVGARRPSRSRDPWRNGDSRSVLRSSRRGDARRRASQARVATFDALSTTLGRSVGDVR